MLFIEAAADVINKLSVDLVTIGWLDDSCTVTDNIVNKSNVRNDLYDDESIKCPKPEFKLDYKDAGEEVIIIAYSESYKPKYSNVKEVAEACTTTE